MSYVLYGRVKGRRVSIYIPEQLVPDLLYEAAMRYVKALKRARATAAKEPVD